MKKKTVAGLIGVAAAGLGAAGSVAAISSLLYNKCVAASAKPKETPEVWPALQEGRAWAKRAENFRSLTVPAVDGLKLWAALVPAKGESHRWAICVHGYRDSHEAVGVMGKYYVEHGWNVLMPDLRGHGNSQGSYVGWSYDDRLDLVSWINYVIRRDPEAEIVIHGVSMGAATVMMATGGPLQDNVKAAVADCGFTNLEHLLRYSFNRMGHKAISLPAPMPFKALFGLLRKTVLRRAGYDLKDVVPQEAVARSKTPTLFIHGGCDEVVPPEMMGKLYEAARCPKRYLIVPAATHADSAGVDPKRYWEAVESFLNRYMN